VNGRTIGVAPAADLASAIVIEGGDVVARVLGGMDWAVGQGVRVLSMSLGFRGWWEDFLPLVRLLRARNILPVFAVGNEGPGTSRSPGNYYQAVAVGAYDESGRVANFSSSQRFRRLRDPIVPDLVAPGVDVISARPGGGYQVMDGTSMATPHIAGLAALLLEAKPAATETQVERALLRSCLLRAGMTRDRAGRGVPDAVQALAILMKGR
jgi:subtilisin family serine protease